MTEAKQKQAALPALPKAYPESKTVMTLNLCDRVERSFFGDRVLVRFPVTEEQSFEHFRLFRSKSGWKVFTARGQVDKKSGEVKPMDMGSLKLPYVCKTRTTADGKELLPLYRFTYLIFKKGTKARGDPERNWSYVRQQDLPATEQALFKLVFSEQMNHILPKLYRASQDLKANKSDGINWHSDNGGKRHFRDLHPATGFEDYILYPDASSYRWLQVYEPKTQTTCNLLLPSGALVTFTGAGNRELMHCVPKETRSGVSERITLVARRMVTEYDWLTRKVYPNKSALTIFHLDQDPVLQKAIDANAAAQPVSAGAQRKTGVKGQKRKAGSTTSHKAHKKVKSAPIKSQE